MSTLSVKSPVRSLAIATIGGYQRYLSPHKGFACAHRVLYGGLSCSEYVKQAIAQYGVIQAIALSRQRFQACKQASLHPKTRKPALRDHLLASQTEDDRDSKPKPQHPSGVWTCTDHCDCCAVGVESTQALGDCASDCHWTHNPSCHAAPDCDCSGFSCEHCSVLPDCSGLDCSGVDCCSWG